MAQIKNITATTDPSAPAIIFLHGLDGHGSKTWMTDPEDESTLWPKWLAADINCAVFLVAYDAALSRWQNSAMPLPDQGDSVLDLLASESDLKNRPLILVGHSMGGLVIKTLIHNGLTKGVARYQKIVEQIRGVVFIGTPHKGSQLATLAKFMSPLLRTNAQVKNMQNHDEHLRSLNQQFLAYYNNPPSGKVAVRTFAETQGIFIGKKIAGFRIGPTTTIVDPDSSEPHVPGEIAVRLPEDHISICKLANKDQPLYKSLLQFVRDEVDLSSLTDDSLASNVQPKPAAAVSTGNIHADNGSVAVGVLHGSFTINNK